MHNIKKRLVSAFLLFAMALSFYPSAFAANESQIDTATSSTVTSKVNVDSSTSSSVTSKADDATDADDLYADKHKEGYRQSVPLCKTYAGKQ